MNKPLHCVVGLLLGSVLLLVAGCGPTSPPVSYYRLTSAALPAPVHGQQSRVAVQVGPVSVPDVLKKPQLVFGGGDGRYQLSDQHRWADGLDRDIAQAIGEQLAARLHTEQIALFPEGQYLQLTHQVVVDILTMEGELGKQAVLVARWSVVDLNNKTASLTRRSVVREQSADSSHGAWVAAQRHNIAKLSEEIAGAIASVR